MLSRGRIEFGHLFVVCCLLSVEESGSAGLIALLTLRSELGTRKSEGKREENVVQVGLRMYLA